MNYRVLSTWSLKVAPSKEGTTYETNFPIKITNVALGDDSETPNTTGRTTLKMAYEEPADFSDSDDEGSAAGVPNVTAICSLSVGKVEHLSLDVVLHEHGKFTFTVSGENTVYLTGVQIDEILPDHDHAPNGDWDSDEEEDAFALQDVSSDVEMEADGFESDASRFEEVHDEPKAKDKKRPRDSLDADADAAKISKAEKKKAKKQKGQDGKAVPVEAEATPANAEKKEKKEKKEKGTVKELPGGLKVKDATIGTGPQAKKGQRIEMRYIGKLQNGKVFDSNTKGKPFAFRLGQGEVIKGWDEGLVGMQVGGERVLTIPPGLAYGKKGSGPIPANATLTFECKLVNIK